MRSSGPELALVRSQLKEGASLFGCEDYLVLSDAAIWLSPGPPVPINAKVLPQGIRSQQHVPGAMTATWLNTEVFIQAWGEVVRDGRYQHRDWVVKLDPDTVFFPRRLRQHLRTQNPAAFGRGVYLKNCPSAPRGLGLFGSMEVLSREAVSAFSSTIPRCRQQLASGNMGEDFFTQMCLDLAGAGHIDDYGLLNDGYCGGQALDCSQRKVAYHPRKTPEQWFYCWGQTKEDLDR